MAGRRNVEERAPVGGSRVAGAAVAGAAVAGAAVAGAAVAGAAVAWDSQTQTQTFSTYPSQRHQSTEVLRVAVELLFSVSGQRQQTIYLTQHSWSVI